MTHVVLESCIRCKYTDCVDVCPVDCFREGPNFLTIDPDECIDCAVCIPECPVNAIVPEEDVPGDQQHMTKLNAELASDHTITTLGRAALLHSGRPTVVTVGIGAKPVTATRPVATSATSAGSQPLPATGTAISGLAMGARARP